MFNIHIGFSLKNPSQKPIVKQDYLERGQLVKILRKYLFGSFGLRDKLIESNLQMHMSLIEM